MPISTEMGLSAPTTAYAVTQLEMRTFMRFFA